DASARPGAAADPAAEAAAEDHAPNRPALRRGDGTGPPAARPGRRPRDLQEGVRAQRQPGEEPRRDPLPERTPAVMTTVVPIRAAAVVGLAPCVPVAVARCVCRQLGRELAVTSATATAAGLACFAYFKCGLAVLVVASTQVGASVVRFWLWRRSSNAKNVNRK